MPPAPPPSPASRLKVAGVVLFYIAAALSMVMANKWVLNTTTTPLFFLMTQCIIAVLLFLISDAMRILPDRLSFEVRACKGLVPMVSLSVLGLSLSNYTLKYVDASFYQVARGLVLPFTVCVSGWMLHTRPSLPILFSCAIVTAGFFIGVFLDGTPLSMVGVGFGVASSTITATHSVIIKQSLKVVNDSTILLSWYTNLLNVFVLLPIVMFVEGGDVMKLLFGIEELAKAPGEWSALRTFVYGSLITGVVGFLMSLASLLSIKVTSPITHMVSSAVRGVAASLLGMWLFHDVMTSGRASSIAIILFGSIYYTWVKHKETEAARPAEYERVRMSELESGHQKAPPQ
ncbi:TPT domain-containing protein [Mycena indigotica]|uniref:TPT domain-containing protein n=1 Tax=Mycena indigotica TaxID=2126181 RepID=A0A8H6VV29_9AGAR|nr:TPT domain-containing protein [Mycena indigotica]KAF7293041.1 TPT domain-containing protein [Mycena indigotica]